VGTLAEVLTTAPEADDEIARHIAPEDRLSLSESDELDAPERTVERGKVAFIEVGLNGVA
jgi:hypothetical protein